MAQCRDVVVTRASDIDDVLVKGQCLVECQPTQFDVISELHISSRDANAL